VYKDVVTDHLTQKERSENMGRIRNKDTMPERVVRSLLHRMGYRFRLHKTDLPGNPDLVLPRYRTVVMVHGCYWHRHTDCPRGQSTPTTNKDFWKTKFDKNQCRDQWVEQALTALGWKVMVVWECETKPRNINVLEERLRREIDGAPR
jgi:DNA mismatch endonuclease (patch repair protein)